MIKHLSIPFKLLTLGLCFGAQANAELSNLNAVSRNNQVFITWNEKNLTAPMRLSVFSSSEPINLKNLAKAEVIASLKNPSSSTDWWKDSSKFLVQKNNLKFEEIFAGDVNSSQKAKKGKQQVTGFVISNNGKPIAPFGGLHVHSPNAKQTGMRYYAVAAYNKGKLVAFTANNTAVKATTGFVEPIALSASAPKKNAAKNLPLVIALHGRGGGVGVDRKGNPVGNFIFYAPSSLAWQEGIPFKFTAYKYPDHLRLVLNDRVWIGRILDRSELSDGRDKVMAISTFWVGYNPNIATSIKGPKFVCDNQTERLMVYLIRWAQRHFGCDPAATYIIGGSMGGTGAVQMATHFPEVISAVNASVPVVSFTFATNPKDKHGKVIGSNSAVRIMCTTGKFTPKNLPVMPNGTKLLDYLNGALNIGKANIDMPPIFATSGRRDASIPWINNPAFFAAANKARQALTVFWNDGDHGMTKFLPKDMQNEYSLKQLFRYRLDKSFPVFSNSSDNKNFGNGHLENGDITGWLNRGITWKDVVDTKNNYAISIAANHPEMKYPVTTDITIRRRQNFKPAINTVVKVKVNGKETTAKIDKDNLLTVEKVVFNDKNPVRIEFSL